MKKILHILLLLTGYCALRMPVNAQAPDIQWMKLIGSNATEYGYSVKQTADSGYVICGSTDVHGTRDVCLIKTNSAGDTLWTRVYGDVGDEEGYSIDITQDGGYIITGVTNSWGNGGNDVFLIKTDSEGHSIWSKTFGSTGEDLGRSVKQTNDGGYIVTGWYYSVLTASQELYLIKTNQSGDSVWIKTYGGSSGEYGFSVLQTNDNGYIVTGRTNSYGNGNYDVYLIKTNSSGDTLWTRTHGGGNYDSGNSICVTEDNGYVIAGRTQSFGAGGLDIYIIKTNQIGDTLWTRTYGGTDNDYGVSVQPMRDGGYIVTGFGPYYTTDKADEVIIVRTNSQGDTTWIKTIGETGLDQGWAVQQTYDGGFIIAGFTGSFGALNYDAFLIKFPFSFSPPNLITPANNSVLQTHSPEFKWQSALSAVSYRFQLALDSNFIDCLEDFSLSDTTHTIFSPIMNISGHYWRVKAFNSEGDSSGWSPIWKFRIGNPWIVSTTPPQNALNVADSANIAVKFAYDVNSSTLNNSTIKVNGSQTGLHTGTFAYDAPSKTVTINPVTDFKPGEIVTVTLTTGIQNTIGDPMESPFGWSFTVDVEGGSGVFSEKTNYPAGSTPASVFSADFDLDRDIDLAVANRLSNSVSIYKNNGNGIFTNKIDYPTANEPVSVISSDFDSDGDIDLAVSTVSPYLSVLKNNGDGTFAMKTDYMTAGMCWNVTSSDFDSDGDIDIAAANSSLSAVSIFLNNGNGTFADKDDYPAGSNPTSLVSADFDSDGDMDLAVTNNEPLTVSILINNGDGAFTKTSIYNTVSNPSSIISVDFDSDGDMDLALVNLVSDKISIFKNIGNGAFSNREDYVATGDPNSVFSSDFDYDGDIDLVVSHAYQGKVSILKNNGNGLFTNDGYYSADNVPGSVHSADFDSDGDLDLAIANLYSANISVLKNINATQDIHLRNDSMTFGKTKSGTSKQQKIYIINNGGKHVLQLTSITSTDPSTFTLSYTADTILAQDSIAVTVTFSPVESRYYNDSLTILSNDPDEPILYVKLTGACSPNIDSVTPGKNSNHISNNINLSAMFSGVMLNNTINSNTIKVFGGNSGFHDGTISYDNGSLTASINPTRDFLYGEKIQAVITDQVKSYPDSIGLTGGYSWKFTTGTRFGSGSFRADSSFETGSSPMFCASADFNLDGFPDAVTANSGSGSISVMINNKRNGYNAAVSYTVGTSPQGVAVSDVNNDGYPDILCANNGSNNVSVLLNNGNGTFQSAVNYNVGTGPRAIHSADLDNDGNMDIVAANVSSNTVSILLNNENGTFASAIQKTAGTAPSGIILEDLDLDGDIDIGVSNKNSNNITILLNDSSGVGFSSTSTATGTAPNGMIAYDFDGDGDVDLATANGSSNNISILLNNGTGTFSAPSHVNSGKQPISLYGNDFNADGHIDIAVANYDSSNVILFSNNGSGAFVPADTVRLNFSPRSVSGLDLSGQFGVIDLVAVEQGTGKIHILRNELPGPVGAFVYINYGSYRTNNTSVHLTLGAGSADSMKISGDITDPAVYLPYDTVLNVHLTGAQGPKQVTAIFKNAQGNESSPVSAWITFDAVAPGSPTGLTAVRSGSGALLQWNPGPETDLFKYIIYRSLTVNFIPSAADSVGYSFSPDTEFTDTTMSSGNIYYYKIVAVDSALNYSSPGNQASLDAIPPEVPQGLYAQYNGTSIQLNWTLNSDPDIRKYVLYRSTVSNFIPSRNDSLTAVNHPVQVIQDMTFVPGNVYYYRLCAVDTAFNYSAASTQTVTDLKPPAAPAGLSESHTDSTVWLRWTANSEPDVAGYILYRSLTDGFTPSSGDSAGYISRPGAAFADTSVESGHVYFYRAAAKDTAGNISPASVQLRVDIVLPSIPAGLAVAWTDSCGELSWNPVSDPDVQKYVIYRSLQNHFVPSHADSIASVSVPAANYRDRSVVKGYVYYYRVSSVDTAKNYSPAGNQATLDFEPPKNLQITVNSGATSTGDTAVNLTLSAEEADSVKVYGDISGGTAFRAYQESLGVHLTPAEGLKIVNAVFKDSMGNQSNFISDSIVLVKSLPALSVPVTSPLAVQEGNAVLVRDTVRNSLDVRLVCGKGSQTVGTIIPMNLAGNVFSASIPDTMVTKEGAWYRITAVNALGQVSIPSDTGRFSIPVLISASSVPNIRSAGAYPEGIRSKGWNTYSVPYGFSGIISLSALLGAQDTYTDNHMPYYWSAYSYDAVQQKLVPVTEFHTNQPYFIYHTQSTPVQFDNSLTSLQSNDLNQFGNITLKNKWNLISWPYAFRSTYIRDPLKTGRVWEMKNGKWTEADTLKPYKAYMISNKTGQDLTLRNAISLQSPIPGKSSGLYTWTVQFKASDESFSDDVNQIGTSSLSSVGSDPLDEPEPPSFGAGISLYFLYDIKEKSGRLCDDIRNETTEGHVWDMFLVNHEKSGPVTLTWEKTAPDHLCGILIDVTQNTSIDLMKQSEYVISKTDRTTFKVIAGNSDYVRDKYEQIKSTLPDKFALHFNYPNPFNPMTTIPFDIARGTKVQIKIYNMLGQEVTTLADTYYETGRHQVIWNGKNQYGQTVASGVYLCRLSAGGYVKSRKLLLVK